MFKTRDSSVGKRGLVFLWLAVLTRGIQSSQKLSVCWILSPVDKRILDPGLAWRTPCLPHSPVLLGARLAGGSPSLPHSQVLMGFGLAGGPLCLPYSQVLIYRCWVSWGTSLSTTQSGPYGC